MQQELIEMLEKMVDNVVFCNGHDQRFTSTNYGVNILKEAEALVEKAKNSAKEPAVPQGEPVYQLARATGPVADAWIDVAKDVYDDAGFHPSDFKRRILYAAPSQPAVPQGFKPVGYLRSDEFDGHVFEPIDGTWPFDELLFSLSTAPAPAQEVVLTDEERADMACAVAAICTGTSSRTVAATAIEWTERALRAKGKK